MSSSRAARTRLGLDLGGRERLAGLGEQHEPDFAVAGLLVTPNGRPGPLAIHVDRLWREDFLDGSCLAVEPGEPKRSEKPERDCPAVRHRVAGGRLECVRERVPEVQLDAVAVLVRVTEADGGLECRARADLRFGGEVPERLAQEQTRLHDLGEAVPPLLLRERVEKRRVDQGPRRPVERADEVLALAQVHSHLAADRRVHLTDERRGHGDPVDAAEVRRGDEAGEIGRGAASDGGKRRRALDRERMPETFGFGHRLRRLARRNGVGRRDIVELGHAHVRDDGVSLHAAMRLETDPGGGEHDAVEVARARIGALVQRASLVVQRSERLGVAHERAFGSAHALPRLLGRRLEVHGERMLGKRSARPLGSERPTAELDDGGRPAREDVRRSLLLVRPERGFAARSRTAPRWSSRFAPR